MEKYIDIVGFEGLYQVSNFGNIKSLEKKHKSGRNGSGISHRKERILKPQKDKEGYLVISLSKNGKIYNKKIHRLVAISFIENTHNKHEVNHKNGIKSDNNINNLEWASRSENLIHAYKNKLKIPNPNIEKNRANGMLTAKSVFAYKLDNLDFIGEFFSINEFCRKFKVCPKSASKVLRGDKKYVKGMVLKSTKI